MKINKKIKCYRCGSLSVIKRGVLIRQGFRKTLERGKQQKYFCKICGHRFVEKTPLYRMKNSYDLIDKVFILHKRGLSLRQIKEKLNNKVSHTTIFHWIKKWSQDIEKGKLLQ
jgi:transposase-like protein